MNTEEELYQSVYGDAAASDTDSAAEEAAEIPVTDDTAHTETVEEPAVEEVEVVEETTDAETTDETAETETDTPTEEDNFQDLLDPIPTPEQLLEKHKATRPSQAIKDDLTMLSTEWRKTQDSLDKIGGQEGITALEPVAQLLKNATPTSQDALGAFDSMLKVNRDATLLGILESTSIMLEGTDPIFKLIGDELMQKTFGNGVTTSHIRNLVALEQAGYIQMEEDMKSLGENTDAGSLFAKQTDTIRNLEKQLAETQSILNDPEKLAARTTSKADQVFETDFDAKIQEAVTPFLEKGKWNVDSALAKHVLPSIINGLKNEPEYRAVKSFVAKDGYTAEKMPFAVSSAMNTLTTKAKARVAKAISEINADLRAKPTLNAVVKEKVIETKPKSVPLVDRPYSSGIRGSSSIDREEDELYKRTLGVAA